MRVHSGWLTVLLVATGCAVPAAARLWTGVAGQGEPRAAATRVNPVDGAPMVWIPPGAFAMGAANGAGDERPVRAVRLTRGFWMYRTEVTTAQWERFLKANPDHQRPKYAHVPRLMHPDQPAVAISWEDAVAYCHWAGARLPTEAEWEYAARGTEGRPYPWGKEAPHGWLAVFFRSISLGHPDPAGAHPEGASPFGVLDMAGSVWEWCADWYSPYPAEAQADPTGPPSGTRHVVRGGGWTNEMDRLRATARGHGLPTRRSGHLGFRPVWDAPATTASGPAASPPPGTLTAAISDADEAAPAAAVLPQNVGSEPGSPPWIGRQHHPDARSRAEAALALGRRGESEGLRPLCAALSDPDALVRYRAAYALGRLKDPEAASRLAPLLLDSSPEVVQVVLRALEECRCKVRPRTVGPGYEVLPAGETEWQLVAPDGAAA